MSNDLEISNATINAFIGHIREQIDKAIEAYELSHGEQARALLQLTWIVEAKASAAIERHFETTIPNTGTRHR